MPHLGTLTPSARRLLHDVEPFSRSAGRVLRAYQAECARAIVRSVTRGRWQDHHRDVCAADGQERDDRPSSRRISSPSTPDAVARSSRRPPASSRNWSPACCA